MSTQTIAGVAIDVNDEGFLTDPEQWTRDGKWPGTGSCS